MRIARFQGADGADFAVSSDGSSWTALAPAGIVVHSTPELIARMDEVRDVVAGSAPQPIAERRLLAPVHRPGKILAIGLNYIAHAAETRAELPERPLIFAKYSSSLNGPFDDVVIGESVTAQADYESELAVVIGRDAKRVSAADAMDHVFGYAVANDVSARDHQRRDGQFSRSKSADTFCPIGPWITTADEVADVRSLAVTSTVNGELRQQGVVSDLVFDIPTLIAYVSSTITLEAGDVILTGTPPGVGLGMTPPVFLADGDVVECTVEGLGSIRNRFVDGG
jgi:2-keto-4-pentenoate hydratase/2-oxohepta-3-ene-1,7-dioic acid hydratase in catechol pathway